MRSCARRLRHCSSNRSLAPTPLHNTFVISSLSSLPGPPDPHRWSLSFTRSFSLVSKSPIALFATQHPISGTDFLHHSDYHVPPVVLHSQDLLLACLIWCSTLVTKLTFSPGPFLHSFSQESPSTTSWIFNHSRCWNIFDGVGLVHCGRLSWLC